MSESTVYIVHGKEGKHKQNLVNGKDVGKKES